MSKITRTVVSISAFFEDFDQEMEKYGLDYKKLSGSEYFTDFEVTGERTEDYLEKYLEGSGLTVEQHQENIRLGN